MEISFSGSIDTGNESTPSLGSYKAVCYGSISVGDTSRYPIGAIYNSSTGSVDLLIKQVKVSVSPKADTNSNDVCFVLGARATGSISGSVFNSTPLDLSSPVSNGIAYGATISGPTIGDPMNGCLVQAQATSVVNAPSYAISIVDLNDHVLESDMITLAPGGSYVVSLTQFSDVLSRTTVFPYLIEFGWDEKASA